jgi:predicted glycosyltransferase
MKYLFYIGHPAHYHNFKFVSQILSEKGHEIIWVVREKDVLFSLLDEVHFKTYFIKENAPKNKSGRILRILRREFRMLWIMIKHRPNMAIGTDLVITHIGNLLRIPSVIVNEDDAEAVPLFANMGMKYASNILAPECCSVGPYRDKSIFYKGYQELAYLHPDYFTPDRSKVESLFAGEERFFLLRFASLTAHHDDGVEGINDSLAKQIIGILESKGKVWITSERPLSNDFEQYRIAIPATEIHHALFYADLYIGDSQTMAAEAAVLGTPSLRFNDFVGKLSYLEELEHKYKLTFGIKTDQKKALLEKVAELSSQADLKEIWEKRREVLLHETIDVTQFWVHFFESCKL